MLVVTFDKIETNRKTSFSGSALSTADRKRYSTSTGPGAARELDDDKEKEYGAVGNAGLDACGDGTSAAAVLGCVGVAPARRSDPLDGAGGVGAAWITKASIQVKLMLQVNEPGALLFMGDGHARQGDGEVVGTGMTSMDVEFAVDLIKKKTTVAWPRLENDEYIMVLASARLFSKPFSTPRQKCRRC